MLPATSQRRWWLRSRAANGAASCTSAASRGAFCLSKCCVVPFFPVRMASYFYGIFVLLVLKKCIYTRHVFMLFSSPQDVASHQPKELVARIERDEWSGELHLGRFEARIVLVKVFCCVFFPLVRMTSYFCGLSSTRTVCVLFFPHLPGEGC